MIVVGGMIGIGKTTTTKMLEEELSLPSFFETVKGNEILPLFYKATPEEKERKRYPFLLQLSFLRARFHTIREALKEENAVLDRSIFEDRYFAKKNFELGNISEMEMKIYDSFFKEILQDLQENSKGKKTVLVYLHGSFETVLKRIQSRGRSFEMGKELISYYRFLYDGYDEMMRKSYPKDSLIDIDVDKWDLKRDPLAKERLFQELKMKGMIE